MSHVLVIGGGFAGLLTARVLSDFFDNVTLLERDLESDLRGIPQQQHIHVLQVRGQQILEQLYPGFDRRLADLGAPQVHWGIDTRVLLTNGYVPRIATHIYSRGVSRATLQGLLRGLTEAIPNIQFLSGYRVKALLHEQGRICGLRAVSRKDGQDLTLPADLLVDTSGRQSKSPSWLAEWGYPQPDETSVNPFLGYASRWYLAPHDMKPEALGIALQPRPREQFYRGSAVGWVEDRRVVITLAGINGDYPPTDEAGFVAFARSLPDTIVYDLMQHLQPMSPIYGFRAHNRIRHYERMKPYPERYLVLGDAFCTFNPFYGQGMMIAAMQVETLQRLLKRQDMSNLDGFARRFQRKLHSLIQLPWLLATGEDMRYPRTVGQQPSLMTYLAQKYVDLLFDAAVHDTRVAQTLLQTVQMTVSPLQLARPDILARALWANLLLMLQ